MSKKIQIAFGNSDIFGVDISYYCEDAMQIGDLCFLKPNKAHNLVTTYELAVKEYLEIIGISMNNVLDHVGFNTYNALGACNYSVPIGSKIQILTRGEIVLKLPVKWKIPVGLKLYIDPESGKVSWRKGLKYCRVVSAQNELGFVRAKVKF